MLHAGLDLSRKKLDVCLLSGEGEHLDQLAVPPDGDTAMSQENAKVVLAAIEAQQRRNLQAFRRLHHPNIEWDDLSGLGRGT